MPLWLTKCSSLGSHLPFFQRLNESTLPRMSLGREGTPMDISESWNMIVRLFFENGTTVLDRAGNPEGITTSNHASPASNWLENWNRPFRSQQTSPSSYVFEFGQFREGKLGLGASGVFNALRFKIKGPWRFESKPMWFNFLSAVG